MRNPEELYLTLSAAYGELRAAAKIAKERRAEIAALPQSQQDAALNEHIADLKRLESTAQSLLDITLDSGRRPRRNKS